MTNDPTSDKQLEQIKQCQGFGGDEPLPDIFLQLVGVLYVI